MKLNRTTARQPQKTARGPLVKSTKRVSGKGGLSQKTALPKVKVKKAGDNEMISKAKHKPIPNKRSGHAVAAEASAPAEEKSARMGSRQNTVAPAPAPTAPGESADLQEASIAIRIAGEVPRDADAGVPQKERGSYDGDTAIKLYLREIGQV